MLKNEHSIALYGLSTATQEILEQIGNKFNIVGLLDGYRQEGMIYGKPIISMDEAIQRKVDAIVIVARPSSRRIIVNRIREVCKEHNIKLYDVNGNDLLSSVYVRKEVYGELSIKREELLKKINRNEVISFDIFDTLITRKVMYPSDVFELVEQKVIEKYGQSFDFSDKRQATEHKLSRISVPTIQDIYKELGNQIALSESELEEIQKIEWEIEQQIIVPRYNMCQIFRYALEQQKKVYLVSDMYYTEEQLTSILSKLGIMGYEKLIVSCEYGTTKKQKLFQVLKEEAKANHYLHIGDNYSADVQSAQQNGIDGIWIKSGLGLFDDLYWSEEFTQCNNLAERVKLGMFIARVFNSPFAFEKGNVAIEDPRDLGYLLFAPILTDFIIWLYHRLKEMQETTILFCARDGFLMRNLFDRLLVQVQESEKPIKTIYFLTSRISAVKASLFNEQGILHVAEMDFNGSFKKLLETRFALDEEDISEEDFKVAAPKEVILKYKELILKRSQENRGRYLKYIDSLELGGDKVAFFDFVSSGTCQAALEKIMNQKMQGYYFIRVKDNYLEKKMLQILSFFDKYQDNGTGGIYEDYFVLENILTSPMPSLKGFDEEGKPQYLKESRSGEQIDFIGQVHEGILQYFEQYVELLQAVEYSESKGCSEKILGLLHKISIENDVFHHLVWDDSFYARSISMKELM